MANGALASVNLNGDDATNSHGVADGFDTIGEQPASTAPGFQPPATINMLRPSTTTVITINGGAPPTVGLPGDGPGDVLNLDVSYVPTAPTRNLAGLIVSTTPGVVIAAGYSGFTFASIEDINLVENGEISTVQMGDLFLRGTNENDLVQFANAANSSDPLRTRLRFNAQPYFYFSLSGKTVVYGADGIDNITQANVNRPAHFFGEAGDDILAGALLDDLLVGGDGNDRINGGEGNNIVWGDNYPTTLVPFPQDLLAGGNDQLSGGAGNDIFYGGGGIDSVSAGAGDDFAYGGQGNDTLTGSAGNDRLYGGGRRHAGGRCGRRPAERRLRQRQAAGQHRGRCADRRRWRGYPRRRHGHVQRPAGERNCSRRDGQRRRERRRRGRAQSGLERERSRPAGAARGNWVGSSSRAGLGAVTQDLAVDTLTGGAGADDFSFTNGLDTVIDFLLAQGDEQF
jgi:Ca2+-binding RTX toxin-like protein